MRSAAATTAVTTAGDHCYSIVAGDTDAGWTYGTEIGCLLLLLLFAVVVVTAAAWYSVRITR